MEFSFSLSHHFHYMSLADRKRIMLLEGIMNLYHINHLSVHEASLRNGLILLITPRSI
jgi:hypothetical protein